MRLIHMRKGEKKGICARGELRRNVAGDEFSVRSVLISVLGNLYADYKKLDYYTKSLLEFSDAEFTAKAMLALVDENPALAEYKDAIEEDIAEADDAEDVARARSNIKNGNLQLNFFRKLIEQILNHELPENHFFCNKVTEITPINAVARFFSLSECEARLVAFSHVGTRLRTSIIWRTPL